MPIYRYKCLNCENESEVICSISKRELYLQEVCAVCGCSEHESIIGKTTFALKGKGWYKDGYNKIDNS